MTQGTVAVETDRPISAGELRRRRIRRVALTAGVSLAARAGSILVLVVTVPLTFGHLGPERFGIWMVLSTLAAAMTYADFGIGNGVLNKVAQASADNDNADIRKSATNGFYLLLILGILIAILGVASFFTVPWAGLFNVRTDFARQETSVSVLALLLVLAVTIPATIASKVQFGLQEGYGPQAWLAAGSLSSLLATLLVIRMGGGVPLLILAFYGSQAVAYVVNSLFFFFIQRPDLAPVSSLIDRRTMASLLSLGSGFFVLQIIGLIAFRLDTVIVTRFFGPVQAGYYAIAERLFALAAMVVGIVLSPLWPAYGEAAGRGDREWLSQTLVRSLVFAVGATVAVSAVVIAGNRQIMELWLGKPLTFSLFMLLGFAVWRSLEAAGVAIAMLMNGLGALTSQAIMAASVALIATGLKFWLIRDIGIAWINWLTATAYLALFLIPSIFVIPRILRQTSLSVQAGAVPGGND